MGLFSSIFGGSESSQSPSTVWGGQAPFLQGLYQRAYNASLGQGTGGPMIGGQGQMGGGRTPSINQLRNMSPYERQQAARGGGRAGIQPAPGQPGQGQAGAAQDPLSALGWNLTGQGLGMVGQLGMLGQAGNPFAMGQIDQLGQGLGRLFQQQIAPSIQSQFGLGGTLGGSRQALALGQAGEGLGQAFTGGALDILGNSAQLALGANQAGLQGLGNVFGMGNAGVFGSLPGLAGLLGGPTVLGGGGSSSSTPGVVSGLAALFGGGG